MLYILYLYVVSFVFITNCSQYNSQKYLMNDQFKELNLQISMSKWKDLDPMFREEQEDAKKNFIAAYNIINELHEKCYELDHTKNTQGIPIKDLIGKTQNQIQQLYNLGKLSEEDIYKKEDYIKRNCSGLSLYRICDYYNHFRASMVVAENIWCKIFNDVEELGLDPEELTNNI